MLAAFSLTLAAGAAAVADPLEIVTAGGKTHRFEVELADDQAERSRGLMFRTSVPPGTGMLFDFDRSYAISMWMKNTPSSLDMLFIRADGTISRIAERTVPFSEKIVSSGNPVRFVLEVAAGTSSKLGIRPGDKVRHASIPGR